MRVLVLGATGMLGSCVFSTFQNNEKFEVWGTLRDVEGLRFFPESTHAQLIYNVDVINGNSLVKVFEQVRPDIVINCIGLIKQLSSAKDPLIVLPINAMLPHQLANLCKQFNARLIHISTDCVFSGRNGGYTESDASDAEDLYGKSKFIGEVTDVSHAITLRTSMIGHELNSKNSLIDWFLTTKDKVKGYVNVVFSGLPTVELAQLIRDVVIPQVNLFGLYHVASKPINKYDLLKLVAEVYEKRISIVPDEQLCLDRSLNSKRFTQATGYVAPTWPQLIEKMHQSHLTHGVINA